MTKPATRRIGRRRIIKWTGLSATSLLGLPLLDAPRVGAQSQYPLRLVLLYNPNGTIQDEFWPTAGTDETAFEFNGITRPLEPFRDRLLFLKGLSIAVAATGPGGPHQKGLGGLFTGRELQPGKFVDGDGAMAGWANGISVDQAIAGQVGKTTLLSSLELGVRATQADVRSRMSYAGPGNPMPPINSPRAAFERLFFGLGQISEELRETRRSVLDVVSQQYAELQPRLGAVDQQKIAQHFELLRRIERRLDVVPTDRCAAPALPPDLASDDETTMDAISQLQVEILATGLGCDLTRVASIQYSSAINDIRYPWLDSLGQGHALSHAGQSNTQARDELIARHTWHAEQMASLMRALDAISEGEGTALDNTIIVWGNELGLGNAHSHTDIPIVIGGGAQGQLKMGRFLQFQAVPHSALLLSLMHAMGLPDAEFGHPDYAVGPLPGLT